MMTWCINLEKQLVGMIVLYLGKSEDHWSCIARLSAEDMLKSEATVEKKIKNIESE